MATLSPVDDILAHWKNMLTLARSPESYSTVYPLFHLFEGAIYSTSSWPTVAEFATAIAFLSIMVVISFYVLARIYLKKVDRRLPIFATTAWFLFSGFGWLYLIREKLGGKSLGQEELLNLLSSTTYWDTQFGQGPWLWLWLRPITVGFTLLFMLLYLLKRTDIEKSRFIVTYSLLVTALSLTHLPELIALVGVLTLAIVFSPRLKLRLKEATFSTFIGIFGGFAASQALSKFFLLYVHVPWSLILMLISASFVDYLVERGGWAGFHLRINKQVIKFISLICTILFFGGLMAWLSSPEAFSVRLVGKWGQESVFMVPWLLYSVLLGCMGLFFVLGLPIIARVLKLNRTLLMFIYLAIFAVVAGHITSFLNTHFFSTGYWERRFIPFLFTSLSLLGPLALIKSNSKHRSYSRIAGSALLISLVVVSGVSSTFLSLEWWTYYIARPIQLGEQEQEALAYLYDRFQNDPAHTRVFTVSSRSQWELRFAVPRLIVKTLSPVLWEADSPESALWILYGAYPKYSAPYIYLHERDIKMLSERYSHSYMAQMLSFLPPIFENSKVKIYRLPEGAPPSFHSDVVLLNPPNVTGGINETKFWGQTLLSLGGYNCTTSFDIQTLRTKSTVVIPSDEEGLVKTVLDTLWKGQAERLIILNLQGFGPLSQAFFTSETKVFLSASEGLKTSPSTQVMFSPIDGRMDLKLGNELDEKDFLVVSDSNHTSVWKATPYGSGKTGIAVLNDDIDVKATGESSLRVDVGDGEYAQWQISRVYDATQDWSSYDFFEFYWYGKGDSNRYIVEFLAPDHRNYFWHEFVDSWEGWRRVVIPLRMPEGRNEVFGVNVGKTEKGSPKWDQVQAINIRLSAVNPNLKGTWFLDKIGLDVACWSTLNVTMYTQNNQDVELQTFNDSRYISVKVPQNEEVPISSNQLTYLDGTSADLVFPTTNVVLARLEPNEQSCSLVMSVKIPPSGVGVAEEVFQLALRLRYPVEYINAEKLEGKYGELKLPTPLKVVSADMKNGVHCLGWYSNKTVRSPLAASCKINDVNVTYINLFPLVNAARYPADNELFEVMAKVFDIIGLNLSRTSDLEPWILGDILVFKEATFQGMTKFTSDTITFVSGLKSIVVNYNGKHLNINNVTSIDIDNVSDVKVSSPYAELDDGNGFYTSLRLEDATVTLKGNPVLLFIRQPDGQETKLNGSVVTLKISGPATVMLRTPSIEAEGNITIRDAYALHNVRQTLRASNKDVSIEGKMTFKLPLMDTYGIARDVDAEGNITYDPPLLQWNEWESLKKSVCWLIVATLIATPLVLSPHSRNKKETQKVNKRR